MQWWYGIQGQQHGPVEDADLAAMARDGRLSPADLVWNPSMGAQWAKASTVPGLFPGNQPGTEATQRAGVGGTGGQTPNGDLMTEAREALNGRWGLAIGLAVVYWLVLMAVQVVPGIGWLISFLIAAPMELGLMTLFLGLSRRQEIEFGALFHGFRRFGTAFLVYLLRTALILLWAVPAIVIGLVGFFLFLHAGLTHARPPIGGLVVYSLVVTAAAIPAYMATLAYSLVYFVLADQPDTGAWDIVQASARLMKGRKWKLFCLYWRFFGWAVLCLFTCGIGFLWLVPYMMTSFARFYDDLGEPAATPHP